ncbi:mechanosensitive ion channel family protein [Photobacterium sp. 1_MG-2023]|uniref:mechanosensitive ion channel family protein n=1 Tax=Photobacterium sp. 1_MG-2023 TaxID=3062646 RepID=UPI0026E329DD|nr:mechanosensitive ion channel family protein [Photobacterium sp. 1_MG-2023]MDO6706897.1 mechanosensitive ion channel family protein [Photobacterium sp. 1_MG-2023]
MITEWFNAHQIDVQRLIDLGEALGLIAAISIVIHLVLHRGVILWLNRFTGHSETRWHQVVFGKKLFSRFALLIQGIVIAIQAQLWLSDDSAVYEILQTFTSLWIVLYSLLTLYAVLGVIEVLLGRTQAGRNMPLRGISQSLKIIFFVVAVLLSTSILIGKSPVILLSGLGAMTAVIMLVFKDPILGLVAGIQLSANKMLSVGDWLEMPKYGADGDVIDISLTTVKVQNWDKTITTIPTYALISDSFKNWKGMQQSGGRRIKRSLLIDATSVSFLSESDIHYLQKAKLLEPYMKDKVEEISQYNAQSHTDLACRINGRRLTNLGSFRAYLERYLRHHPNIHQQMTLMVRQLPPTHDGIALELYCFTNTTIWVEYERIQSDIFDHLFAVLPEFGLRVSQAPTGHDFREWRSAAQSQVQKPGAVANEYKPSGLMNIN